MIRVGIAGIGFMGMIHFLTYQRLRGVRVTALCEQDARRRRGDWRDIKGNFGPAGRKTELKDVACFEKLQDLVNCDDVDLIDICLPPALHADVAVSALRCGKHVFCEKPMALTVADTRRMEQAAGQAHRMLLVGHVLPMFPEYRFARQLIASGKCGKMLGGTFTRVISDPLWLPHFHDPRVVGGSMLDVHVHDAHFIRLVCGMPSAVTSQGRLRGEVVEYFSTQFAFPDPDLCVTATGGVIRQQGRSFLHGYEIHFENATAVFQFAVLGGKPHPLMPCTVIPKTGRPTRVRLGSTDPMVAFNGELKAVVRGLQTGHPDEFLSASLARDAIRMCQAQTESVTRRRRVRFF
jgi:predicted dehydrogenase